MEVNQINNLFGDADLFLIDWILKGNIPSHARILDAGSGSGRNLIYFLSTDHEVVAIDQNESEINALNLLSRTIRNKTIGTASDIRSLPFQNDQFDFVICSRVLHFAKNEKDFMEILNQIHRVIRDDGTLYLSLASTLGFQGFGKELRGEKIQFPDGSVRLCLNDKLLKALLKTWSVIGDTKTVLFNDEHIESTLFLKPIKT